MAGEAGQPAPSSEHPLDPYENTDLRVGQRVRTTANEEGRIVGFYIRDDPTALVALDHGGCGEFPLGHLTPSV